MLRPLTWSLLLSLRSNPLLQTSQFGLIVIPVFANIILTIREFFPDLTQKIHIPHGLEVTFLLSACIVIANIVIDALCPEIVRRYRDADTFEIEAVNHNARTVQLKSDLRAAISSGFKDRIEDADASNRLGAALNNIAANQSDLENFSELVGQAISKELAKKPWVPRQVEHWRDSDQSRLLFRWVATLFYVLAALAGIYIGWFLAVVRVIETS